MTECKTSTKILNWKSVSKVTHEDSSVSMTDGGENGYADNGSSFSKTTADDNISSKHYFVLPYIGKSSERLFRRIRREFIQHRVQIRPAYRTIKVGSYFSLKSPIPPLFKTDVVYEFKCPRDEGNHRDTYIGETRRQLFQRISEHSPATKSTAFSAVKNHIAECSHCQDYNIIDCFKILRVCGSGCILSEEALCIKRHDPNLNIQMGPSKGAYTPISIF